MRKSASRALFRVGRWVPAGILLLFAAPLPADTVTYYYNSLDSNPDDFVGTLTLPSYFPGQDVPILTFSLSAVVRGETLTFTTGDQAGSAEAQYDTNPTDPLSLLYPYPSYSIVDPMRGGEELILGPTTPAASSLGAPRIVEVPSSPVVTDASDNGVWLLTPPGSTASTPEPSTVMLLAAALAALGGLARWGRRV
jgi:hypothetical protein